MFRGLCETLILVAHTKDKQINFEGQEVNEMTLDLTGRLGDILCGEADAIGYVYRKRMKPSYLLKVEKIQFVKQDQYIYVVKRL